MKVYLNEDFYTKGYDTIEKAERERFSYIKMITAREITAR